MSKRADSDDFKHLFLNDVPMMDVRAPVEYKKGAFPESTNLPLLDDQQRHVIGIRYKEKGQDAAIELGWELATSEIREQRLQSWKAFADSHPDGYLYCFRGGLRSRLTQQLLSEAGVDFPLVKGGYKAMRRFLIDEMETHCGSLPLILVSGRTACGKTRAIQQIQRSLDLERLANHRGSAFGRRVTAQPSQIDFENRLSVQLLRIAQTRRRLPLFTEDEGKLIGSVNLPLCLQQAMATAPLAVLETPLNKRISYAMEDYVTESCREYRDALGEDAGNDAFRVQVLSNVKRIRKRLGGDNFRYLYDSFSEAIDEYLNSGDAEGFEAGIKLLLTSYYDPMYDYQQRQRRGREVFRGSMNELVEWANRKSHPD